MKEIYIKYDYDGEQPCDILDEALKYFSEYDWGGGFKLKNLRYDGRYLYADGVSEIYDEDIMVQSFVSYAQGMISGFLIAKGVEIF